MGSRPIEGPPAARLADELSRDKVAVIEFVPETDPAERKRQRDRIYHRLRDAAVLAGIRVHIRPIRDEHGTAMVALPVSELEAPSSRAPLGDAAGRARPWAPPAPGVGPERAPGPE